jgi:hypothetical protein
MKKFFLGLSFLAYASSGFALVTPSQMSANAFIDVAKQIRSSSKYQMLFITKMTNKMSTVNVELLDMNNSKCTGLVFDIKGDGLGRTTSTLRDGEVECEQESAKQKTIKVSGSTQVQFTLGNGITMISVQGKIKRLSSGIEVDEASATISAGLTAVTMPDSDLLVTDCESALFTLSADIGNFIPREDGREIGTSSRILEFTCND